jgi:hypothetical protein
MSATKPEIFMLNGVKVSYLAADEEDDDKITLSPSLLKKMTGGDQCYSRKLYEEGIFITSTVKQLIGKDLLYSRECDMFHLRNRL